MDAKQLATGGGNNNSGSRKAVGGKGQAVGMGGEERWKVVRIVIPSQYEERERWEKDQLEA